MLSRLFAFRIISTFVFVFFFVEIGLAQEHFILIETAKDFPNEKLKEVIPITDNKNENIALLLKTKKGLESYLYNANKERINHISIEKLPLKSDVLVGSANIGNDYRLFYSNKSDSQFSMVKLNFDIATYAINEDLKFKISNEKFVKYISLEDRLYLLTLEKNSSTLKLYTFDMDGHVRAIKYDLSHEVIENDNGLTYNLSTLIYHNNANNKAIEFVDESVPNALETTSAITKIYYQDGQIILTNNLYTKFTYKITLDIQKENYTFQKIENAQFTKDDKLVSANSFIFKNHILTAYANGNQVYLNVFTENPLELVKTFTISKDEPITFKNGPIYIENGDLRKIREVEKSGKFVRKVAYSNVAISLFEADNKYIVTLGSSEPVASGNMILVGYLVGGIVGAAIFSAFETYSETKSTRIQSLFDLNFNHLEGEVPKNGFDIIKDFINSNNLKHLQNQSVFKFKEDYVWGSYNRNSGYYRLYTFPSDKN